MHAHDIGSLLSYTQGHYSHTDTNMHAHAIGSLLS